MSWSTSGYPTRAGQRSTNGQHTFLWALVALVACGLGFGLAMAALAAMPDPDDGQDPSDRQVEDGP